MKGTILDFLKLTSEKPDLGKELIEVAEKYDFTFSDEVSDEELDAVAGGSSILFEKEQQETADQIELAKNGTSSLKDQYKATLGQIAEMQQRQQQNVHKIIST